MNGINGINGKIILSIIIVSYNTKQVTDDCLRSIYNAKWTSPYEIIVVDNNSQDGSVQMIIEKYPQVILIENNENKLFAKANNQGAALAKGKYLLLLNSDTIVWGDNLQRMIDYIDHVPEDIICVGPKVLNADKTIQSVGFPNYSVRWMFVKHFWLDKILPLFLLENVLKIEGIPTDRNREVGFVAGCCVLIRSNIYKKIGGLNESIEFYGEEVELGYRLRHQYGLRTWCYRDAEIIHLGGKSTPKLIDEEISLRRYAKLVNETVKTKDAIAISRITIAAARIKRLLSKDKKAYTSIIDHENKVIDYLKCHYQ